MIPTDAIVWFDVAVFLFGFGIGLSLVSAKPMEGEKLTDIASLPMAPSTPSPDRATLVFAVVRALLQLLGGLGIGVGALGSLPDSSLMIVSGLSVSTASAVWSLVQKYRAKSRDHLGSVATAERANRLLASAGVGVRVQPLTPVMTAA